MVGIELVRQKETKEPYPVEDKIGIRVIKEARNQGLIIRPLGNVIILMPPLSITAAQLKHLTNIAYESIKKVTETEDG